MKFCISFLLISLFAITLSAQVAQNPSIRVSFTLHSPDLPSDSTVYITGSIDQLGSWNPGKVPMDKMGSHVWKKEILVDEPMSIEYKYTLGTWEREGATANGLPLSNLVVRISGDTSVNDSIYFWTKGARERVITGQITGTVKYHPAMKGAGIQDRDVIVWLPPGYDEVTKIRYPVIYMHDGQNIFDPATSSFGTDWEVDEACDSLIRANAIPPVIVVGIYNTPDRMKEYRPGELGSAYLKFIVDSLKPFIDATYRTKPGREHTYVGGSSAGGICAFMLVWEYPGVFSRALCMSPAFKVMSIDYVKTVQESKKRKNVFFYIDNGGVGLESQLQPGVDAMIAALKEKGYKEGKDFTVVIDADAQHFESAWANRFPQALLTIVGDTPGSRTKKARPGQRQHK